MSLEQEREQTVQLLCRQFAQDYLTTPELEAKLEAAYKASTLAELRALTAGLPAVREPGDMMRQDEGDSVSTARAGRVLSVFGSIKKRGDWDPAPRTRAIGVFSEMELDFRDARIAPGVTTVDVSAVFASVRIIVPPGLHLECDGAAIMGTFEDRAKGIGDPAPGAPTLRIVGTSVFSEVVVVMRLPDETAKEAKRRERALKA